MMYSFMDTLLAPPRGKDAAFTHAGFLGVVDLLPDEKEYVEKEIARRWSGSL